MSGMDGLHARRAGSSSSSSPPWWLVFSKELRELWIGGKALSLILLYTVLLGLYAYLLATNTELKLMPLKEMVLEMVKASIAVSLFISLVIGADSVSGERERATLEGLLLTPASRRQIIIGKFLAAVSPWPVALAIAIPYWNVVSQGDEVFARAVLWGSLLGSLLAPAFAGLGMVVSIWCNTNKASMVVSLGLYLLLLLPTRPSGPAQISYGLRMAAYAVEWANPVAATSRFLSQVLVNNWPPAGLWFWLTIPVLFAILVLLVLFVYASAALRLEAGTAERFRPYWVRVVGFWSRAAGIAAKSPTWALTLTPSPQRQSKRMYEKRDENEERVARGGSASPTWWLVFLRNLSELWIGGKALNLILIFSVLMGLYSYVMARDSALSLVPPSEMVYEALKAAIVASVFIGLIIGADSLSGERERATLEGLLLTPTSRREIVVGKFLAAASPWPVALLVCIPYLKLLSQGTDVFGPAVLWGAILGSLLAPAFTGLGMLVSFWSHTNKTSMFVSLGLYILFLLPTQLPGHAQAGSVGRFFQWVNPMQAPNFFLAKFLVNNRTLGEIWHWLTTPFLLTVLVFGLLFVYAGPGLRLEAGTARRLRWLWGPAAGLSVIACLLGLLAGSSLMAQEPAAAAKPALESPGRPPLEVSIDVAAKVVQAGTPVLYNTVLTNNGSEPSPPLIMAMNIINLQGAGEPVDPEDWSPQRTQYLDGLGPGKSVKQSWRVNAILDGDFMIYMVAIPAPGGPDATSQPVASSGIHLTVTPFTRLNPGGVLPYAIGGPVLVALAIFVVYRIRRRGIDSGDES